MATRQSDLGVIESASLSNILWSSLLSACILHAPKDSDPNLQPELPVLQTALLMQEHSKQNQLALATIQSFVALLESSVEQDQASAYACCIGLSEVLELLKGAKPRAEIGLIDSGTFGQCYSC